VHTAFQTERCTVAGLVDHRLDGRAGRNGNRTRRASGPRSAGERSLRSKQKAAKHHHPAGDARRCSSDLVLLKGLRHNEL